MTVARTQNRISIWGVLVAIFAALAPMEGYLTTQVGSLLKFYTIGCLCFAVLYMYLTRKAKLMPRLVWWLVAFGFMCGLSVLWSDYMLRGVDVFFSIALQVVFVLIASMMPYTKKDMDLIIWAFIISSVALSIILLTNVSYSEIQYVRHSVDSTEGKTFDPNDICALIVCGYALLIAYPVKQKYLKVLKPIALCILIISALYTASRGGFVTLILVSLLFVLHKKGLKKLKYIIIAIVLVTVVIFISQSIPNNPMNYLIYRFESDSSGSNRVYLWQVAIEKIAQKPFFGYGLGESPYIISKEIIEKLGSHNTYLTIIFEAGLMSFIPFVVFIVLLWRKKKQCYLDDCAFLMLVAGQCAAQFFDVYNKKIFWFPVFLCVQVVSQGGRTCLRQKSNKYILRKQLISDSGFGNPEMGSEETVDQSEFFGESTEKGEMNDDFEG